MSDRNWEQELAKIDKQLASVSDEQLLAQGAPQAAPQRAPLSAPSSGKNAPASKSSAPIAAPARTPRSWIAWLQLTVAIAAGAGLWFWPWNTRCGLNAISFTAATGAVTALGLWSAVGSWRHRQGMAHILSFMVIIWGLVLGAREVLPRMGYAIPTVDRPAGWGCTLPTVPSVNPSVTPPNASPAQSPSANPSGGLVPLPSPPSAPAGSAPLGTGKP